MPSNNLPASDRDDHRTQRARVHHGSRINCDLSVTRILPSQTPQIAAECWNSSHRSVQLAAERLQIGPGSERQNNSSGPDIAELNAALHSLDVVEQLDTLSTGIVGGTPEETSDYLRVEAERWNKVARIANVKLQ